MKVSEKRLMEWWEAPGIAGREDFDEEILYLNSLAEQTEDLPRWALAVRDLMPRWGFEPCAHRFPDGLEQVLTMVGMGRAYPRVGECGDVPLRVQRSLEYWGRTLVRWAHGGKLNGPFTDISKRCPDPEAALAAGEAVLAVGQGRAALDATLERWTEEARSSLAQELADGDDAPLTAVLRHPCCFNIEANLERLTLCIANEELPKLLVCRTALREAPQLDPGRLVWMRGVLRALGRWVDGRPPGDGFCAAVHSKLGSPDPVRRWLVASLYKSLKLWAHYTDNMHGARHRYRALV